MNKKIAVLHDWLDKKAGAENVLEQILKIYPNADLFTLVDFMSKGDRGFLGSHKIATSFIQKLPFAKKYFRLYFPLFPLAIYLFKIKRYDIVISCSHSYVKNISKARSSLRHICYCCTPIRYCYDMKNEYINDYSKNFIIKFLLNFFLSIIAFWDKKMTKNVDSFMCISKHIKTRINTIYSRNSEIIYPSIDFRKYSRQKVKKDIYYVAASRFVPYKKIDLLIKTFNDLKNKKLYIIGDGERFEQYKLLAKSKNIKFLGWVSEQEKISVFSKARALIYPAFEDFGIVPIEAQACGTPVIAYGKGGLKDTVVSKGANKTGIFFNSQTKESIKKAIVHFEEIQEEFSPGNCKKNAKKFDHAIFTKNFNRHVNTFISSGLSDD
jgi:glycosyltransferase involved in cell wall biosynthesis